MKEIPVRVAEGVKLYRGGQPNHFPAGAEITLPAEHADALHEVKHVEKVVPAARQGDA